MPRPDNQQWEFGPFRFDGIQHLLFRDGEVVPLSRKASHMLLVLLENQGRLVEKDVLMRRVWPDSFVEESNLAVHISQLRKILSEEGCPCRIETIPRHGYRFIGKLNSNPVPEETQAVTPPEPFVPQVVRRSRWILPAGSVAVLLVAVVFVAWYLHHRATRAVNLRAQASERERLARESHHYQFETGDLVRATPIYENWAATFPDDIVPRTNLALIYSGLGKFGPSLAQGQAALRIAPGDRQNYVSLASHYIASDSLNLARNIIDLAVSRKLDSPGLHLCLYEVDFLQQDASGMAQQMTWSAGKPGSEDLFLADQANTLAFSGEDAKAAALTVQATEAARRAGAKETGAGYELDAAQREALFGNPAEAKRLAGEALALAHDRDTRYGAALALALAGSVAPANTLADQLNNDFPDDTFVQYLYLPTIRAVVALQQKDPVRAAQVLEASTPYELGSAGGLVPVYVRGLAYLA